MYKKKKSFVGKSIVARRLYVWGRKLHSITGPRQDDRKREEEKKRRIVLIQVSIRNRHEKVDRATCSCDVHKSSFFVPFMNTTERKARKKVERLSPSKVMLAILCNKKHFEHCNKEASCCVINRSSPSHSTATIAIFSQLPENLGWFDVPSIVQRFAQVHDKRRELSRFVPFWGVMRWWCSAFL